MAEPLKNSFGPDVPRQIAAMIESVYPPFATEAFLAQALDGYDSLELTPRAGRIADSLHAYLPDDYEQALEILMASVRAPVEIARTGSMASFIYLPHTLFVARYGLDHFDASMQAQYELTQLFTAEFSVRPYLERYPERTLARLREWTGDPNVHVRRLVSEGTRPRLPWAPRLRAFQRDPQPVLDLLELLKDDPEKYVRRSVANNLNDIGKDHPELLVETCARWIDGASPDRTRLIRHALRSLAKAGHTDALGILGYRATPDIELHDVRIEPSTVRIGERVSIEVTLIAVASEPVPVRVDLRVHFVKSSGKISPKVFRLGDSELIQGEPMVFRKRVSLAPMTTRRHYPGEHNVEILINGVAHPGGSFDVVAEEPVGIEA